MYVCVCVSLHAKRVFGVLLAVELIVLVFSVARVIEICPSSNMDASYAEQISWSHFANSLQFQYLRATRQELDAPARCLSADTLHYIHTVKHLCHHILHALFSAQYNHALRETRSRTPTPPHTSSSNSNTGKVAYTPIHG